MTSTDFVAEGAAANEEARALASFPKGVGRGHAAYADK
jgi:hypothetical protein